MRVADPAHAVLVEPGVVAPVELFESGVVAPLIAKDEQAVAVQVDRARIVNLFGPKCHLVGPLPGRLPLVSPVTRTVRHRPVPFLPDLLMDVSDLDYSLPEAAIAQEPVESR